MTPPLNTHVIREIRAELGRQELRQRVLAPVLGISEAGVSERLRGRVALNLRELEQIAQFLDRPISHFLPADRQVVAA